MGRGLKYDIPGEDWRRGIDRVAHSGWEAAFAPDLPAPLQLVVEIGFGRGEFLLDLAGKSPETAFVGVEVSFKRCLRMARRLAQTSLRNVRLLEGRGQVVLEHACPPASVSALWVNFSDPWPKDRHAHRRLVQAPFVASVERALAATGTLHVATDDAPYAAQIEHLLAARPLLENAFAPDPWRSEVSGRLRTAYEETWREARRPLYFFEYARR
jgi:tRNA (guanine-N7-)-methyltransferase